MSLINQALRKAQRDRTPQQRGDPGDPTPAAYAASNQPSMKLGLVVGLIISVAVLVGLVVGLSIVLFRDASPAPAEATPQTSASTVNQPSTPAKVRTAPDINEFAESSEDSTVTIEALRAAREAAEAKLSAEKEAAQKAAEKAAAKPSQTIIAWIAEAKIAGVKLSNAGNKVLINGRAYRAGEMINYQLGLRVLVIEETRILFIDQNDKKYMKRL